MYRLCALFLCVILFTASQASAANTKNHGIMVEQPWARASAGPAKAGAAYMTLANMGEKTDRLVGVKSNLANRTEIHNHLMEDGVMKMVEVKGGLEVSPGTPTVLQPGGLHVMFMGLKKPFVEGERLPLTLIFEDAGEIAVDFVVNGVGAKAPANDGHTHEHGT